MSFKYAVLKKVIRLIDFRKNFRGLPYEIIAKAKKKNKKNKIPKLKDKAFDIGLEEVMGFPVMKMIHRKRSDKANLFIIGGGMINPPGPGSIKRALKIARQSGVDLFIPYYPLCTDYPVSAAFEMINRTYGLMLKSYKAENISVLGSSSGGFLALGIPAYINANKMQVPMPSRILAISPGSCMATEKDWERVSALDSKDILVPAEFMKTSEFTLRHGQASLPDYMIWLQKGDFTGCCKVYFMYGTDEVLYGMAPAFEEAMKKYNVDYEMIVGEGLYHCYPVFPVVKEAKSGYDMMIKILKGEI